MTNLEVWTISREGLEMIYILTYTPYGWCAKIPTTREFEYNNNDEAINMAHKVHCCEVVIRGHVHYLDRINQDGSKTRIPLPIGSF